MNFRPHLLFIILLIILAIFFGFKITQENGWSGWGVFSAQTLLSVEHWQKDGFLQSKLLFIPIGYSKIVQYLDDPAMRQHARGTTTGGLIGNRLYYTHYPSGYLFPYAILAKLGVDPMSERPYFRLLSLLFSFSALILLYCFFNLLTKSPLISFFAILYYSISTMFLDYADSLANQPIDELLRNLILVISLLAVRYCHRKYLFLIWFLYFILCLSSYDSTFFVFIWLVGLDIITFWPRKSVIPHQVRDDKDERGDDRSVFERIFDNIKILPWKKWLFFASAPILAFGLQMLQNYWYLGWPDVWLDVLGSFLFRSNNGPGGNFLEKHIRSMFSPLSYMTALRVRFAVPLILILIAGFAYFKRKSLLTSLFQREEHPSLQKWGREGFYKYLPILFLAGLAYAFIFTSSGYFPYQGRQWMPWFALLIGAVTVLIIQIWHSDKFRILFLIFTISVIFIWGARIWETAGFLKGWPNRFIDGQTISFYKSLKNLTANDAVIFNIDNNLSADYEEPNPIEEYYADRLILNFKNFQDFMRDYLWLKSHSEYFFDAIIVSPRKELTEGAAALWSSPDNVKSIDNKYILLINSQNQ